MMVDIDENLRIVTRFTTCQVCRCMIGTMVRLTYASKHSSVDVCLSCLKKAVALLEGAKHASGEKVTKDTKEA